MTVEQIAAQGIDIAKLGAGIAIGFGAIGGGLGIGIATKGAVDSVARQPAIKGFVFTIFLLGAALAEATAIYGFVIAYMMIK